MRLRRHMMTTVLLAIGFCAGAIGESPRTWNVSPTGSDSNAGTETAPFRTIQKAADVVNPGDTVIVEDGIYTAPATSCSASSRPVVCVPRGGTADAWVTFQARHPGGAKLDGQNNTSTSGFYFRGASYVTLSGFEIFGMGNVSDGGHGVFVDRGHDIVLSQLHIHDIGRLCTSTSKGQTGVFVRVPRVTITRSAFHDIGRFLYGENGCTANTLAHFDHAIYVSGEYYSSETPGASDTLITNNIFYRLQRGYSVQLYPGTLPRMSILNNTFAFPNTPSEAGQIVIDASTSDSRIMNNVFYQPRTAAIQYYGGSQTNLQIKNNIVHGVTKLLTSTPSGVATSGTLFADPKLVNAVVEPYDFHLLTVSPAVNAGLNVPEVTNDYDGILRDAQTDVSASEYAGGVVQKVATPAISPSGGVITELTLVTIATSTAGSTIRYTLDGSIPGPSSPVYLAPLSISTTTTVKALASAPGMTDSDVATASFQLAAPPLVDTIPPTVAITSPSDGSRVGGGWTTIRAAAADNVGVASVTFEADGQAITIDTSAPYSASYRFSKGVHTVTVVATDTSGNTAADSITVRR